jgi:uncharacterized Zn finger protein
MDGDKSARYQEAAQWLGRARTVLHALGRANQWSELRAALL